MYAKDTTHYYKLISGTEAICVRINIRPRMEIMSAELVGNDNLQPSTQEEFEKAYNEVSGVLRSAALELT